MACEKCGGTLFEVDYVSTSYGQCVIDENGDVQSIQEKGSDNFDFDGPYICTKCGENYEELP